MAVTRDDIPHFFAHRSALDAEAHVELDFTFECAGDPRLAAAALCSEQSTAQWRRVGVDEDFRPRFAAKVVELHAEPQPSGFSYQVPDAPAGPVHRCRATLAHPHANFGPRLPNLMTAVLGEGTYFAPGIPIIRLEDLRFPASYLAAFRGPRFGVAGLRRALDVHDRPFFIGVIKPNIGLAPADFAAIGEQGLLGGLDIAKDDEMMNDAPWSPLAQRAAAMGAAARRASGVTGRPLSYMASITDEVSQLTRLHDLAVGEGATTLLVNALPVGLSGVRLLCEHATVPVFTHFPFIASFSRLPRFGVHPRVMTRLQRLAGADAVIMPGFGSRMLTPEADVLACVQACLEPMGALAPSLPVPGGSDSAETLPGVYAKLGTRDFGFVCGRGVFGHPGGPAAGARSLHEAWGRIVGGG